MRLKTQTVIVLTLKSWSLDGLLQGFLVPCHNSTPQAGGSVWLEADVKTNLRELKSCFFFSLWDALWFWRMEVWKFLDCVCPQNGRWKSQGEAEVIQSVKETLPLSLMPSFITTAQYSTVQSSLVQISKQDSNPWGWVSMTTVRWCSYHGCHCCRWWSDRISSSCWLSTSLEDYKRGLAGSGFTQCHGLQTLGLIQVPATHLGIAGQEL